MILCLRSFRKWPFFRTFFAELSRNPRNFQKFYNRPVHMAKNDFHLENVIISLIGKCSKSLFYSKSLFGYSFLLTTRLDGFSRSLGVKLYFFKTYFLSQVWDIFFRSSVFFLLFLGFLIFRDDRKMVLWRPRAVEVKFRMERA